MAKKTRISAAKPVAAAACEDVEPKETQISSVDMMEMMRHEHASELAKLKMQLAQANDRAIRLEITQAAKAAADGLRVAHDGLNDAKRRQSSFAQQLADRYHFQWTTHTFCPDSGIVRRVTED